MAVMLMKVEVQMKGRMFAERTRIKPELSPSRHWWWLTMVIGGDREEKRGREWVACAVAEALEIFMGSSEYKHRRESVTALRQQCRPLALGQSRAWTFKRV
ncbi:hypothetical protein RJ640_018853 [Escallonia rubra]|uniref:Uncharacterized protein n=1 Tax=Escallonia rubra TaxID=112253 RepID=A0AA88RNM3_9ASTE|nr:hypothetical protein RJ640_018853 [Escallonia rubra]